MQTLLLLLRRNGKPGVAQISETFQVAQFSLLIPRLLALAKTRALTTKTSCGLSEQFLLLFCLALRERENHHFPHHSLRALSFLGWSQFSMILMWLLQWECRDSYKGARERKNILAEFAQWKKVKFHAPPDFLVRIVSFSLAFSTENFDFKIPVEATNRAERMTKCEVRILNCDQFFKTDRPEKLKLMSPNLARPSSTLSVLSDTIAESLKLAWMICGPELV